MTRPVTVIPRESEAHFQAEIVKAAKALGWRLVYHTFDSRRSSPGFPDLVLCKPPRVVFLEVKGTGGRATPEQREWNRALRASGQEAYFVWPNTWNFVVLLLQGAREP